jgi:hypothetical protein
MKNIRRGIGVLALACAITTVGACSGNNRTYPDWGPRVSRGTTGGSGASARNRTRVKRNGDTPNGNNGRKRGQKNGNSGNGNGNGNNGKKRGNS